MLSKRQNGTLFSGIILYRLFPALVLLLISRLCLYMFNPQIFGGFSLGEFLRVAYHGLRFDLAALFMLNALLLLFYFLPLKINFRRGFISMTDILFILLNALGLAANMLDVVYFRFSMKRSTGDLFDFVGTSLKEITSLIPNFIFDFWWVFVLWILMIAGLIILVKIKKLVPRNQIQKSFMFYITNSIMMVLMAALSVLAIRGGVQLKPMSLIDAGRRVDMGQIPLVLNTPFAILSTFNKEGLEPVHFFDDEQLAQIYSPVHFALKAETTPDENLEKLNVVVIILESFGAEYTGFLNKDIDSGRYKGYTPFLDSLMGQSLVFKAYANAQQSREGIPAVVSSIPALTNKPYINSVFIGNKINSLASVLKAEHYRSAFFHGGLNGTMDFDAYAELAGFDGYFGKDEYGSNVGFDGKWGIADEDFLQYTAAKLNGFQEPFFATIFTLSSHHPYTIPGKYKGKFEGGPLKIHKSVQYADFSLRQFFKTISKMDFFNHSLFVITADHTSLSYLPAYKTSTGKFRVPILYYRPGVYLGSASDSITQQTDIMPSVLDYLHVKSPYIAFGSSVFDSLAPRFAMNYYNETYQLVRGDYVLRFDGSKSVSLFNQKTDPRFTKNLIRSHPEKTKQMEAFAKAFIQQFNSRMINNDMIIGQSR